METLNALQIILMGLCCLGGITVLIFAIRYNNSEDEAAMYYRIGEELEKQKEIDLKVINEGNKEINRIEKRILECKERLGMNKFDK